MFERLFAKRGLSLDRLRVLIEVREAGSIVKAAGNDPVRQSQYSRQLKELEEYFGVELTSRKGRTISLTAAGEELATLIKEHFIALGNFSRRLDGEQVPVFIGAGESLIHWVLIPLASKLQGDIPNVAVRLLNCTSTEIGTRLANRDLDMGLLRADATTPAMSRNSLGKICYSLYVPKPLYSLRCGSKNADLFSRLPIATMPGDSSIGRTLHNLVEQTGKTMNVRLECNSFTGLARAVETGAYAAVLPSYAAPHIGIEHERIDLPLLKPMTREIMLAGQKRKAGLRPEIEKVQAWLSGHVNLGKNK